MIMVQGWVRMASAAALDDLRPAALEMIRATRALEPGCLEYSYAVDLVEPALLRVIERWTDEAAITAHFASPHMAVLNQAMASAAIVAASVKAYAGDEVRTLIEI